MPRENNRDTVTAKNSSSDKPLFCCRGTTTDRRCEYRGR